MTHDPTLLALAARIEKLTLEPGAVRAPWARLLRPLLVRVGYAPRVRIEATTALLEALRAFDRLPPAERDLATLSAPAAQALAELERNVVSVERACVVDRRSPVAHAAWLGRVHRIVRHALDATARADEPYALEIASRIEPVALLPPMHPRAVHTEAHQADTMDGATARLLDLELGAVDHLLDAARDEDQMLGRRRRLLEAARQMLLDVDAALPLEADGVNARRTHVAREIARLDRVEAAGVDREVGLLHQARTACTRGETGRLVAALTALDAQARARGDRATVLRTSAALDRMWNGLDPRARDVRLVSLDHSARELFGPEMLAAVERGYRRAQRNTGYDALEALVPGDTAFHDRCREYFRNRGARATMAAAVAADGCFEVGGGLSPVRIEEHAERVRIVAFPTQELVLMPTQDPADLPAAILDDPRTVLLSLAAGRLMARRYVKRDRVTTQRTVLRGEVRVYVLDGSGSMMGPRARMRDAVLLAELATLRRRLSERGTRDRVVVYFRYFDTRVGPITAVDDVAGCEAAVAEVLGTVRAGGTDISAALLASLAQVRDAKTVDPHLARAQIVLVTDGEAPVDAAAVRVARESVGDLPVAISIIALGQENEALRALVASERARGERAFYHFVDDATLNEMSRGDFDPGAALHLPPDARPADTDALAGLLDELAFLGRARDLDAIESLDHETRARHEAGLDDATTRTEGERARAEALMRDRRALGLRFDRWFPTPDAPSPSSEDLEPATREDVEAVVAALAGVTEVVSVVGGSDLARRADAIEMLERMLPDAGLSPTRYERALATRTPDVLRALTALHASVHTRTS